MSLVISGAGKASRTVRATRRRRGTTMSLDQKNLLGSVYYTIIEMTETKLLCYFNKAG